MTNAQATHTLHTPDVVPVDRACALVQDHVCWGQSGKDAGDGSREAGEAGRGSSEWSDMPADLLPTKAALQIPHIRGIMSLCAIQTGAGARQWREGDGISVTISCMLICFSSSFSFLFLCASRVLVHKNKNSGLMAKNKNAAMMWKNKKAL